MRRRAPAFSAACGAALAAALLSAAPARANDTMAVLRTGGLVHVRTDAVAMASEDLFISPDRVRVDYVFQNQTDKDVESVVAFPMPDIRANPNEEQAVPDADSGNFLDFSVTVDGKPVAPTLDEHAYAAAVDVTAALAASRIPLYPLTPGIEDAIAKLPASVRDDWVSRGILMVDAYDDGHGMVDHYTPDWTYRSTYWWRARFPAGRPVAVRHSYRPSVGGTVSLTFLEDGKPTGARHEEYQRKYCIDAAFDRAAVTSATAGPDGTPWLWESWISYVLVTGANWAAGSIGTFHLTVDKGAAENLVSFCGDNVKKTGPTTFEMTAKDFYPERDLDILLLRHEAADPMPPESAEPGAKAQ